MKVFAATLAVLLSAHLTAAVTPPAVTTTTTTTTTSSTTTVIATSASGSTCTTTPIPNPPKTLFCNQTGTLNSKLVAKIDSRRIRKDVTNPFLQCRTLCLNDHACISFGYDTSTRYCTRYSKNLRAQGFKKSSTSDTTYANRHCFNTVCTTPTPSLPPVCTPTPSQVLANPGFEDTISPSDSPPWSTQGDVTFPFNPQNAYSGNYYADLIADNSGDLSSIVQNLTGLDTTKQYVLNFTVNVVSYGIYQGYCLISADLDGNTFYQTYIEGPVTNGFYVRQSATAQPSSDAANLTISLQCYGGTGPSGSSNTAEIYLDDINFFEPDLSCAMYIQVIPSGTSVDNQYLYLFQDPADDSYMGFTSNISDATQFSLDQYSQIFSISPGNITGYWENDSSSEPSMNGYEAILVDDLADLSYGIIYGESVEFPLCSITPDTFNLSCSSFGNTFFTDSQQNALVLGDSPTQGGGTLISLQISYVSYNSAA